MVIACIACIPDAKSGMAEIACLAVHDSYRSSGFGNQLLQIAEDRASKSGISKLYTLTTRSSHWFIEHGFVESSDCSLPEARLARYNPERGSKILLKSL
jgi:amino-acid N-acetyltransferase